MSWTLLGLYILLRSRHGLGSNLPLPARRTRECDRRHGSYARVRADANKSLLHTVSTRLQVRRRIHERPVEHDSSAQPLDEAGGVPSKLATVVAAAVYTADDGGTPPGISERPLILFVTPDAPSVTAGFSSADG